MKKQPVGKKAARRKANDERRRQEWLAFERLSQQILAELQPMADVKLNDFIRGHLTETDRQIDVSIRWSDGADHYLTIVQAKDYTDRRADIKIVDEFLSVIKDVKATGGILICRSGFTRTAHTYARNSGISLLNLHDAQSTRWRLELKIPILWTELTPRMTVELKAHLNKGDRITTNDPLGLPVSGDDGRSRVDTISTFKNYWNGPDAERSVGLEHSLPMDSGVQLKAIVRAADGTTQLRPVKDFKVTYTVRGQTWLGKFQPNDCRGLVDYLDQQAFIASYLPFSEIPVTRDEQWEEINNPAEVVVNVRGTVVTTTRFVIIENGQARELNISYLGPLPPPPSE